jgi:predicted MFS family arabinose efflux permease
VSGYIVNAWGFNAGFLFLAIIAALAFIVYFLLVPETRRSPQVQSSKLSKIRKILAEAR